MVIGEGKLRTSATLRCFPSPKIIRFEPKTIFKCRFTRRIFLTQGKIVLLTQGKIVLLTQGKIVLLTQGKIVLLTQGKIVFLTQGKIGFLYRVRLRFDTLASIFPFIQKPKEKKSGKIRPFCLVTYSIIFKRFISIVSFIMFFIPDT